MREAYRIFLNKRMVFFLIVMVGLNAALFYHEQINNQRHLTATYEVSIRQLYRDYEKVLTEYQNLTGKQALVKYQQETKWDTLGSYDKLLNGWLYEQITYMTDYSDYLKQIQKQAQNLSQISIFQEEGSFSNQNIVKTAQDFEKIDSAKLRVGSNQSIKAFLEYQLTDYMAIVMLMAIVYQMLAERKRGLWEIAHSTKCGRLQLSVTRLLILLVSSILVYLLLYGANLGISFYLYGGLEGVTREIHSVEILKLYNGSVSILMFFMQYSVIKIVGVFLIALCIWLIVSSVKNLTLGLLLMGGIFATEYMLFTFLSVQSFFNIFKYTNIFSYIHVSKLYTNYLNVSVLGKIVGTTEFTLQLLPVWVLILGSSCLIINVKKKPKESSLLLLRIEDYLEIINDKITNRLNVFGTELYKVLIVQKGLLILLFLCYLQYNSIAEHSVYYSKVQLYLNSYYDSITGSYSEEINQKVEQIGATLQEEIQEAEALGKAYHDNRIDFEEYYAKSRAYENLGEKSQAFELLQQKVEKAEEIKKEKGICIYIFNDLGYERLIGIDTNEKQELEAIKAVFFLILLLSSMFCYEKQSGVHDLIRSTKKGRQYLVKKKMQVTFVLSILVWLSVYGIELINIFRTFGLCNLSAPVQSISSFNKFEYPWSIVGFIMALYVLRLFVLQSVGYIVVLISSKVNRTEHSILGSVIFLVLPSALVIAGIEMARYLAVIVPMGALSWYQSHDNLGIQIFPFLVIFSLGIFSRRKCQRIWES